MFVEVVHLLDIKARRRVIMIGVTVPALHPHQAALLSEVLSDSLVRKPLVRSAKALVLIAATVT